MKCDLFSGNFIQMETLRKGREADWRLEGIYRNFVLLLRSLRACSLGVVLGKVAKSLYTHRSPPDYSSPFDILSVSSPVRPAYQGHSAE